MPCKVCKHPRRSQIEQQIAARALTTVEAAKIVGCHNSTVSRHMLRCLAPGLRERAQAEAKEIQSFNILDQLLQSHQATLRILEKALGEGKERIALKALEVEMKQLELTAKVTGQLNEAPQLNLLLDARYAQLRQIIVEKLMPYPEARLALSDALEAIADDEFQDVE